MQPDRTFIIRAATVAAALGFAGVNLVYDSAWGVGMSLFAVSVALAVAGLSRGLGKRLPRLSLAFLGSSLLFALLLSWRSAPELRFLNGLTMILFAGLGTLAATREEIGIADVSARLIAELFRWIGQGIRLMVPDLINSRSKDEKRDQTGYAVARGLMVSVPVVFLFGGLLYSADAGFERLIRNLFDIDVSSFSESAAIFTIICVLSAGILRCLFVPPAPPKPSQDLPYVLHPSMHNAHPASHFRNFGTIEVNMVLGCLNLLFGAFVVLQLPYLFGGHRHVLDTPDLTVANYARRGFFELVTVVALAIPLLVALFAVVRQKSRLAQGMAFVLIVLLSIVAASAAQRMGLYVDYFGLSRLRVYVMAAMVWTVMLLGLFAATTLRGRSPLFAFGPPAAFALVLLGLNVLSPDSLVARTDTDPARRGRFDAKYLTVLSEDATPDLVRAAATMPKSTGEEIIGSRRSLQQSSRDWRSLTLAHVAARSSLTR